MFREKMCIRDREMLGAWSFTGDISDTITIQQAAEKKMKNYEVCFCQSCPILPKEMKLDGFVTVSYTHLCGETKKESDQGEKGEKEKLVIWSWGADEEKKSRENMVEAFQKAHPEIEVEHSVIPTADHVWDQKMTAALSAGTGPDVIQMSPDYYLSLIHIYVLPRNRNF